MGEAVNVPCLADYPGNIRPQVDVVIQMAVVHAEFMT